MTHEISGRNDDGTFCDGNQFSDGRNKHGRQAELKRMFTESCTHADVQRLASKLMAMALDGDMTAARLLLGTLFKDPVSPSVAVQVNNEAPGRSELMQKTLAIADRIRRGKSTETDGSAGQTVIEAVSYSPNFE
jgi:hypothetical protein